ncbi:hypothetical protein A0256_21210 [Mucilaginibacter sp. PAMC 26640]|nr:hypothetical protein A0256_21210 [Mucilaginibacter sp. PAMC 26640]
MTNLVYISTSKSILGDDVLLNILASARKYNEAHHVTGVLLYSDGTFIQALEGEAEDIDFIFARIQNDTRHKNILVMMEREISERNFPNWSMGFTKVNKTTADDFIDSMTSTKNILKSQSDDTSIAMLKTFIETNKLVVEH